MDLKYKTEMPNA